MADVSAKGQVTMAVRPIPEGYHTATPYLAIKGAAQAIEFYKKAFGATEMLRLPQPDMAEWGMLRSRSAIRTS